MSRWARVARKAGVTTADTWHDRLSRLAKAERMAAEDPETDDAGWMRERSARAADDAESLLAYVDALSRPARRRSVSARGADCPPGPSA